MTQADYKGRCFAVYITADGLMDKVNRHCKKYGYSLSKLGQVAIAEKMDREEEKELESKGVSGSQATNQREALKTTPTPTHEVSPRKTNNLLRKGGFRG
jgi:hypothetical protein